MSQEILGLENQTAEINYRRDTLLFLYKPIEWEGEEEKTQDIEDIMV